MAKETKTKTKEKKAVKLTASDFDVLRSPVITEKATLVSGSNQICFYVATDATKQQIKRAVEGIFKVKVESVNTLNRDGKVKVFRGSLGRRPAHKKAYVRLAAGQTIDLGSTV